MFMWDIEDKNVTLGHNSCVESEWNHYNPKKVQYIHTSCESTQSLIYAQK